MSDHWVNTRTGERFRVTAVPGRRLSFPPECEHCMGSGYMFGNDTEYGTRAEAMEAAEQGATDSVCRACGGTGLVA